MHNLPPNYNIRVAQIKDLAMLANIERAASGLFRNTPYPFIADCETLSLDFVKQQFYQGRVWVAVYGLDEPVGYAVAKEVDGNAYLQEIDVYPSHGQKGIGRSLVETVCIWAKQHGYPRVLLSTFRDVRWNAPFYMKLGFQILEESKITTGFQEIRQQEAEMALPIDKRVIMCRNL